MPDVDRKSGIRFQILMSNLFWDSAAFSVHHEALYLNLRGYFSNTKFLRLTDTEAIYC